MNILKYLKNQYKYAVKDKCEEPGTNCTLSLKDLDKYIVLKGEEVQPRQSICDCIVFVEKEAVIAGVIELKSKTVDVSKVMQQLTNGLKFVFEAIKDSDINSHLMKIYVVVLAKKWRKHEYDIIKKKKILMYGKKYLILPKRCGIYFSEIISKF